MTVSGMNHFTILTDDLDGTVAFYRELLDLQPGPRPAFGFPGAWLYRRARSTRSCTSWQAVRAVSW